MNNNESTSSAISNFAQLVQHAGILQVLIEQGISQPTDVQIAAIPAIKTGKDQIVEAQTGSGKTLAFVLPMLERLLALPLTRKTQAIIMTPTRELALQVKKVVGDLTTELQPVCIIGGANMHRQVQQLKKDPRVVIGTPGRLMDLMRQGCLRLDACQMFVLDEADEMLSMGFAPSVREILSHVPSAAQGLFFSATINNRVNSLAQSFLNKPETITVATAAADVARIEHFFCRANGGVTSKTQALCWLFKEQNVESAIIFCNTKSDTELVERVLQRKGYDAKRINSDLSQGQRAEVLDSLRSGKLKYLVATDVAARGIDIKELDTVINYSIHKQHEVYVHRTGRTGRAGATGKAYSIVGPHDFGPFHGLRKQLDLDITEIAMPAMDT